VGVIVIYTTVCYVSEHYVAADPACAGNPFTLLTLYPAGIQGIRKFVSNAAPADPSVEPAILIEYQPSPCDRILVFTAEDIAKYKDITSSSHFVLYRDTMYAVRMYDLYWNAPPELVHYKSVIFSNVLIELDEAFFVLETVDRTIRSLLEKHLGRNK